ncbi:MAG TPA: maleylpyruvate isomerase N-terminal domain-containing protein, partial [Acidimicrobiales bacterium]|nr:maleylpyruvate isomerase N-terminal domain-containing protein [Acidimicrobiales bacterium]
TMRALEATYHTTQHRIVDLLDADTQGLAQQTAVPACPDWSVHDVISHTTGICADILAGNIGGAATSEWTDAQVTARRGLSSGEVLEEWNQVGSKLAALLDDFPGRYGDQLVADLAVHEHDLRGALGRPGERDTEAVRCAVEFLITTLIHPGAIALGLGPLEIRTEDRRWVVGTGEPPTGDAKGAFSAAVSSPTTADQPLRCQPVATLEASAFDLFRAATGRRSREQIGRLGWSANPGAYLALFDLWPFTLRNDDLVEPMP